MIQPKICICVHVHLSVWWVPMNVGVCSSVCACRGQSRSLGFFLCCWLLSCLESGFVSQWTRCSGVHCFLSVRLAGQRALRICELSPLSLLVLVLQAVAVSHARTSTGNSYSASCVVEQALLPIELSLLPFCCLNFKNKYFEGWGCSSVGKVLTHEA